MTRTVNFDPSWTIVNYLSLSKPFILLTFHFCCGLVRVARNVLLSDSAQEHDYDAKTGRR
jgi:hypothetical protein